ncbi:type VI secretion system secreted protein VgrG [Granulicella aggregans]|uniref:Type VI secretion system secreted protein VgrG n=1 Tax=Granulicella aggregans TaxID=474949 RepID=A0A7W7ZID1_9BACT|nr:type VI secretion system tip protein TssI/VgrG [Granulicella aggregans]MBB5060381.1 type VI secretion system secreted protein VgrG [Granulicella aggregans]
MGAYTQNNRILTFSSPLGPNTLLAMAFEGVEAISEIFQYDVEVLSDTSTSVAAEAIVGKRVTVELQVTDTGVKRYFNGIVASFENTGGDTYFNSYRVRMVPMLWLLSLNQQTRVFQDLTVLEIAQKVLEPYSIVPQLQVQESYPSLEYCTQYRETDLHFLERILQQHGIFFYFTHTASDHRLVLSDNSQLSAECPVVSDLEFRIAQEDQLSFYMPTVQTFNARSTLIPGEQTLWDYRFIHYATSHASPATSRSAQQMGANSHERYDFADSAAAFFKTEAADTKTSTMQTLLQNVQRDAQDASAVVCEGTSTATTLQAGFTFTLSKYPQQTQNTKYLVTRVVHSVQQRPGYRSKVSPGESEPYQNQFEARPFHQIFRPEITRVKPRVQGVVTGKVVTFPGEDLYLDRFGRVCVQFWWDRHRQPETPDKTLLRVAQQWAGKGWGTYFWPRVGDEVLIDFMEGDPDAPIVVGALYNGVNLPKYDPKSYGTRSGILTRSSQGGGSSNFNELRFEDRMGAEQIFVRAERDMDHRTLHDHRRYVGNDDSTIVGGSRMARVEGNENLEVDRDRIERVTGGADLTVGAAQTTRAGTYGLQVETECAVQVGANYALQANALCYMQGTAGVLLESDTMICLKVGTTSLTVSPAGVIINGALIPIPGVASAAIPQVPVIVKPTATPNSPDMADDGTKGGKL